MEGPSFDIAVVGLASQGKSTLTCCLLSADVAKVGSGRTSIIPQVFASSPDKGPSPSSSPDQATIDALQAKRKAGTLSISDCFEQITLVDCSHLTKHLPAGVSVRVYDVPGTNDRSDVYLRYLQMKVKSFDLILLVSDITRPMDSPDDDRLHTILREKRSDARLLTVLTKMDLVSEDEKKRAIDEAYEAFPLSDDAMAVDAKGYYLRSFSPAPAPGSVPVPVPVPDPIPDDAPEVLPQEYKDGMSDLLSTIDSYLMSGGTMVSAKLLARVRDIPLMEQYSEASAENIISLLETESGRAGCQWTEELISEARIRLERIRDLIDEETKGLPELPPFSVLDHLELEEEAKVRSLSAIWDRVHKLFDELISAEEFACAISTYYQEMVIRLKSQRISGDVFMATAAEIIRGLSDKTRMEHIIWELKFRPANIDWFMLDEALPVLLKDAPLSDIIAISMRRQMDLSSMPMTGKRLEYEIVHTMQVTGDVSSVIDGLIQKGKTPLDASEIAGAFETAKTIAYAGKGAHFDSFLYKAAWRQ